MPAIINNDLRIFNADAFQRAVESVPTYAFIGKESVWPDENNAPVPQDSDQAKTDLFKDLLAIKRVNPTNIQSVIPRYDWVGGQTYDEYDHRANMIDDKAPDTGNFYRYYVVTDEFNVYKCLSNNRRVPSSVKPTGSPITPFQTGDGYIWKYMYTLRAIDVFSFLTTDWMPCYTIDVNDGSSQWQVQRTAVDGAIEHVVVNSSGSGYDSTVPPEVSITGDGTGASATATVDPVTGEIRSVVMTNAGQGYTEATVSFQASSGGSGASATAIMSPVAGHGFDAKSELGAVHKMIRMELAGSENGKFPATSYRQAGIISLPISDNSGSQLFFTGDQGFVFSEGQLVTGITSGATGIVRYVDIRGRYIFVSNVVGEFIQTESIQNSTGSQALLNDTSTNVLIPETNLVASTSEITIRRGKFMYVSNRTPITRTSDQTEDIRMILSF